MDDGPPGVVWSDAPGADGPAVGPSPRPNHYVPILNLVDMSDVVAIQQALRDRGLKLTDMHMGFQERFVVATFGCEFSTGVVTAVMALKEC